MVRFGGGIFKKKIKQPFTWEEICHLMVASPSLIAFYQEISNLLAKHYPEFENSIYVGCTDRQQICMETCFMPKQNSKPDSVFFREGDTGELPLEIKKPALEEEPFTIIDGVTYYTFVLKDRLQELFVFIGPVRKHTQINNYFQLDILRGPLGNHFKLLNNLQNLIYEVEQAISLADVNKVVLNSFLKELSAPGNGKILPEIKQDYYNTLTKMVDDFESKDCYFTGHSRRVAYVARKIASHMKISAEMVNEIYKAGLLHDVGKSTIYDELLIHKTQPLRMDEHKLLKMHSVVGSMVVKPLDTNNCLSDIIKYHHERYDGYGYPDGLSGKDIPLGARILFLAENFDALISERAYRPAYDIEKAVDLIKSVRGHKFDPGVVDAFLDCYSEIKSDLETGEPYSF